MSQERKAVVLLSGGLDSTTTLAYALADGYECRCLNINYGQRHAVETKAARSVYAFLDGMYPGQLVGYHTINIPDFGDIAKSALTDQGIDVPHDRGEDEMGADIPVTYVPMRNTVFVAMAFALAESFGMCQVFHGANVLDYSGYPDCRPKFFAALRRAVAAGSSMSEQGQRVLIHTPIIQMTKVEIIQLAQRVKAPLALSHSCYSPAKNNSPCGKCDSCILRVAGFKEVGIPDPAIQAWTGGKFTPKKYLPKA